MKYCEMTKEALEAEHRSLLAEYESIKASGLKLDISRGKPCTDQLNLSDDLLTILKGAEDCKTEAGFDCRNYGLFEGVPEAQAMFSELLTIPSENILLGGSSSLTFMYDTIARAMLYGVRGSDRPWCKEEKVKFICPVPGYDRHFKILETFGIEMLCVDMLSDGPDMDMVEQLALSDEAVKGLVCVPKYSNPTGVTFSDEVVERLCSMKTAADDFTVIWDNAYAVHDFNDTPDTLADVFEVSKKYGTENRILYFTSTSKITFPGAGVSLLSAADPVYKEILASMGAQTIGHDKLNQMRHVKFFGNAQGLYDMMKKQAEIVRPHFDIAKGALDDGLGGLGIASWHEPNGGYFISLDTMDGTATDIYNYMKDAGVTLTSVGATFPHGLDPHDSNLRLAPTYPSLADLEMAMKVLVCTVKLVCAKKILGM